jgi:hypothetical protein
MRWWGKVVMKRWDGVKLKYGWDYWRASRIIATIELTSTV